MQGMFLRRQTEIGMDGGKLSAISYLKGFSIFTIALLHLIQRMLAVPARGKSLALAGGTGVHVFFLCSGIGLYLSYLKRKTPFAEFLKRRLMKIYVPYILVVLLSFFVPWMYNSDDRLAALLSHVFLYKMFIPRYNESFGAQLWFVSTIIQLYLLFIPMCRLKEKVGGRVFLSIFMLISVLWWILCAATGVSEVRVFKSFCLQYIWEFAAGFLLAEAFHTGKRYRLNNGALLLAAVLGMGLQFALSGSDVLRIFNDVPALIGYTALALLLMNLPKLKAAIVRLSRISYEYYLLHMLVFVTTFHFIRSESLAVQCLAGLISTGLAIVLSDAYHRVLVRMKILT